MINKVFIFPKFMQKTNKKTEFLPSSCLLTVGSVPELDMHESKHYLPGQFVHSVNCRIYKNPMQLFFYQNAEFDDSSILYMMSALIVNVYFI